MKKSISLLAMAFLGVSMVLGGCGSTAGASGSAPSQTQTEASSSAEATSAQAETTEPETSRTETQAPAESLTGGALSGLSCQADIRIGSLKGPTSMGLASLIDNASKGKTANAYEFTMAGKADELVGKIANGDLDIALLPANVASVLYNKTGGDVMVLDINTLGVLYVVSSDSSIHSMTDLKGRTIYMTGKGTTPEYVMNYLLKENGLTPSDVNLQFKSEATEVASLLKEDPSAIGVLPQPFATAACMKNPDLKTVLDLTDQWNLVNKDTGSKLVTGVTLVRSDFYRENRAPIAEFLKEQNDSVQFAAEHPADAAALIASQGIVENASIAEKALPYCNLVCITGQDMKNALSGYLTILMNQDPKSIGGKLPGDDFYYMP